MTDPLALPELLIFLALVVAGVGLALDHFDKE